MSSETIEQEPFTEAKKQCKICNKWKLVPEFYPRQRKCRSCYNELARLNYHKRNPDAECYKGREVQWQPEVPTEGIPAPVLPLITPAEAPPKVLPPRVDQEVEFVVLRPEVHLSYVRVKANTKEEAIKKVADGDGEEFRVEFREIESDVSKWSAKKA